jgi:hypothetical protein
MEDRGPVVPLDHGDGAAGAQHAAQPGQRPAGVGQVLEDEADEQVVEGRVGERRVEQIGAAPFDVRRRHVRCQSGARQREGAVGDIHRHQVRSRTCRDQVRRLRADATADLERPGAGRKRGAAVQQLCQGVRLVGQSAGLVLGVPVHVAGRHCAVHTATLTPQWPGEQSQRKP